MEPPPTRNTPPSRGERAALTGYVPQYRTCAELTYTLLVEGQLEWVQLQSDDAGQIDDFVIASPARIDAYQIKHSEDATTYTLAALLRATRTRSGRDADALLRQLAVGWKKLRAAYPNRDVHVHLVLRGIPSTIGAVSGVAQSLLGRSFSQFLTEWWSAEATGPGETSASAWAELAGPIRAVTALDSEAFAVFRTRASIDFAPQVETAKPSDRPVTRGREADVSQIAQYLLTRASSAREPLTITREQLLGGLGWQTRFSLFYPHEFPTDARYQPIIDTVRELQQAIGSFNTGYLALVGSPGSGKSTTLTRMLREEAAIRLVRYYAFIPDDALLNRGEAHSFMHDVVLQLRQHGIYGERRFAPTSLAELQHELSAQLAQLGRDWQERGKRTVILVDGLDHIEREQMPERSLISALPLPAFLPPGVLIVLGTQTTNLSTAAPALAAQLQQPGRIIGMRRFTPGAIGSYLAASHVTVSLSSAQRDAIFRISEGHPLALALLTRQLASACTPSDVEAILAEAPQFQETIEHTYETHWRRLATDEGVTSLLGYIARIRGAADLRQLMPLVGEAAILRLKQIGEPYLQFSSATQCQFFHNSFRQFLLRKTGRDIFGETDPEKHRAFHRRLAETAAQLPSTEPFAWEAVYHAYCAGDFDAVIRLGSARLFREQARKVRYVRAIDGDLRLVFGAARELNSPIAAISAALTSREISRRFRLTDDMNLPDLLLSLYGPRSAVQQMVWNGSLVAASESALLFSATLYDGGFTTYAQQLFELAQPLAVIEGREAVELGFVHDEESELSAWASAAPRFRPVAEVISVVLSARIEVQEQFADMPRARNAENHRYRALQNVFASLVDLERWDDLAQAFACIGSERFFQAIESSVDRQICEEYPDYEKAFGCLERLEALARTGAERSPSPLTLANHAWRITKDRERTDEWLRLAAVPTTPTSSDAGMAKYRGRLVHSRLTAIVGRPIDISGSIPLNQRQRFQGSALIDRAVAEIGTLWGNGVAGRFVDVGKIRALTGKLILFFDQRHSSSEHHFEWHSVQRQAPEVFEWLVRAAAAHGREHLQVVADELDQRWSSPPRWPWSFDNQRDVAVKLFAADGERAALIRRLDRIDVTTGIDEESSSRVTYQRDQATAWLRAGELSRAEACFRRMLETANGIRDGGEDDEAQYWVEWFCRQADVTDASRADVELLATSLCTLAKRRAHVGESMTKLALLAGKINAGWNHHLWTWWLEAGATTWTHAVNGTAASLVTNGEAVLATLAIRRLLIPWDVSPDKLLVQPMAKALAGSRATASRDVIEALTATLSTKAFPGVRNVWSKSLAEAFAAVGIFPSALPTVDHESVDNSDSVRDGGREPTLSVPGHGELPVEVAIGTIDSAAAAAALLNANASVYHVPVERLVELVSEQVKPQERQAFYELSMREVTASRILTAISTRLRQNGDSALAEQFAIRALDEAEPRGWTRMYDGGLALTAAEALIAANPSNGRQLTFQRWAGDLLAGDAGISEHFEPFDKLVDLLFERPPRTELWAVLREHVLEFAEYREAIDRAPALPAPDSQTSACKIVVEWFDRGCKLGSPDVEDECVRGLIELVALEACRDALASLLRTWLRDNDVWQNKALAVLHLAVESHTAFVRGFTPEIANLATSTFLTVRRSALHLLSKLGIEAAPPPERPASPIYDLVLAEIAEPEHRLPSSVYDRGAVSPETEDQWEWVSAIHDELQILSQGSGIPLQNLVRRLAVLMREIAPQETWSPSAEAKMRDGLKDVGLLVSWPRLRTAMATRALDFALAELLDNDLIPEEAAMLLRSRIDAVDLVALGRKPVKRPVDIRLPAPAEMDSWRTKDWADRAGDSLSLCSGTLADGRVVLAELTRIRKWTRDALEEVRASCWTSPNAHPSDTADVMYGLLPTRTWWRADTYPEFPAVENIQAMGLYLNPVFVRAGHCEWLVCHPLPCLRCNWVSNDLGTWYSERELMVETIWWQESPPRRADVHTEEITSEGWLVVAAPEAAAMLATNFPCVVRKRVERRIKADAFSTTGETKSAEAVSSL